MIEMIETDQNDKNDRLPQQYPHLIYDDGSGGIRAGRHVLALPRLRYDAPRGPELAQRTKQ